MKLIESDQRNVKKVNRFGNLLVAFEASLDHNGIAVSLISLLTCLVYSFISHST